MRTEGQNLPLARLMQESALERWLLALFSICESRRGEDTEEVHTAAKLFQDLQVLVV